MNWNRFITNNISYEKAFEMILISIFTKIYSVATDEEKKMLLKLIFNKIEIYEDFEEGRVLKSVDLNFKLYNKSVEMTE